MSSKTKYNSLKNQELTKRNCFYHLIPRKIDQMKGRKVPKNFCKLKRKDAVIINGRIHEY